ncbi:MAG: hypothetical protein ABEK50_06530 [bacterium]
MIPTKRMLTAVFGLLLSLSLFTGAGPTLETAEAQTQWDPEEELTLVVLANKQVAIDTLSIQVLSGVFLKNRKQVKGISLEPLNFNPDHPARIVFDGVVHNQSRKAAQRYWVEQSIKGIATPPLKASSTRALLSRARQYSTSITYLPLEEWKSSDYPRFKRINLIPRGGDKGLSPESSKYPLSGNPTDYLN